MGQFPDEKPVPGRSLWFVRQPAIRLCAGSRLDNLAAALASVGASLDQVGALSLYIKQSHMGEGKAISAALRAKFGDNPPCSTWVGVTGLADEQFLIEVEPSVVFLD